MALKFKNLATGKTIEEETTKKPLVFKSLSATTGKTAASGLVKKPAVTPPSVPKQTGGNAAAVAKNATVKQPARQMGIGFNQPKVQTTQTPKVRQTLPQSTLDMLERAKQIQQKAKGKTAEQIRQQNAQNVKKQAAADWKAFKYGAENLGAGALGAVEDAGKFIGTAGLQGASKIAGAIKENPGSKILAKAAEDFANIDTISDKWNRSIEKRYKPSEKLRSAGNINQGFGRLLPVMLTGAAGAAGTGINAAAQAQAAQAMGQAGFGLSAAGAGMKEAIEGGATVDQAVLYGTASAVTEMTIERIAGNVPGLPKGKVTQMIEAAKGSPLIRTLADLVGEGGEEALSEFITPYLQRAIYDPNAQNATGEEIWNAAVSGMVIGLAAQSAGGNINLRTKAAASPVESISEQGQQVTPPAGENGQNVAVNDIAEKFGREYNIAKGGVTDEGQQDTTRNTARTVGGTDQRRGQEIGGDWDLWWSRQKSGNRLRKYDNENGRFRKIQGSGAFRARTETGEPLTVYHSTNADFDSFLSGKKDVGIHFGTEEQAKARGGRRMIKAQLNIQNPLYVAVDDFGNHELDSYFEFLYEAADLAPAEIEYIRTHSGAAAKDLGDIAENVAFGLMQEKPTYTTEDLMDEVCNHINRSLETDLKALGYDSFVYPNDHEGKGVSYAVFDNSQITILDDGRGQQNRAQTAAGEPSGAVSIKTEKLPQRERRQAWNYADKLKKNFALNMEEKGLRGELESLFGQVKATGWNQATESRVQNLARQMVEKSGGVLNEAESQAARDAKRYIRSIKLYITPSMKAEIEHKHGSYNAFRKKHMGKLNMKLVDGPSRGQSIDAYYNELSEMAPDWFPANDNDLNDKDMMEQIIWFVDEDTDTYDHPFETDPEGAAEWIAGQIREGYNQIYTKPQLDMDAVKQLFSKEVEARKALEATERQARLSEAEKQLVSGMLTGKVNPNSVTDQRVRSVFEARQAHYAAQKESRAARLNLRSRYKELAQDIAETAATWVDKKVGWLFDMETAERNIRDIIPDRQLAKRIVDEYFTPFHENEAEATRMKNQMREMLKGLNLGTKKMYNIQPADGRYGKYSESALVQMYGEGRVTKRQLELVGANVAKIENAVKTFRTVYDQLLDMANESLVANGYPPVEKRANYFPHFDEPEPTGIRKLMAKMGMKTQEDNLPTSIAGITDTFRPGKKFVRNFLQRIGDQTEFDALKGFDLYIDSVADVIYHTDDIQRLRALETEIRYQTSEGGIQQQVKDIMDDPYMDEDVKDEEIRKIFEQDKSSLSHFVTWLRKYTDTVAGKKNFSDRDWEYKVGRSMYSTMQAVEQRVAANMVGGNLSSAFTNLIPIFQGTGEVKAKYMAQAMKDVAGGAVKRDGFVDRSDFLTNRRGSDRLAKTGVEKVTDTLTTPFQMIDTFTSETLTRAKYLQNVAGGMDADAAMADADAWAASLIADRSKGAKPLIFTEKNPVARALTMFQLEVNNQFRYMFKDIPENQAKEGKAAIVTALMKIFIATGLYGELFEKVAGYDPTFNPLSLLKDLIEGLSDEEKKKSEVVKTVGKDALEQVPFAGSLLGGGRLPVGNVVEGAVNFGSNTLKALAGEQDLKTYAKNAAGDLVTPLSLILPPVGGNQLKKSVQGIAAVAKGRVSGTDNQGNEKLKFLVEQTPGNAVRGALFGQWSFPEAREYVEGGFKISSAKATDVMLRAPKETGLSTKATSDVITDLKQYKKDSEKRKYIYDRRDLSKEQKAWLEHNLISSKEVKESAERALKQGIPLEAFYAVRKVDNNQRSVEIAVNSQEGLTKAQRAWLWQAQNKSWKAEDNPFK